MAVIPNFSNHTFTRNTALKGGAVSALNNPLDSFKNNFTNNTASMGGEYIISYGTSYIYGDVFITNIATLNGPNLNFEYDTMSYCETPTLFTGVSSSLLLLYNLSVFMSLLLQGKHIEFLGLGFYMPARK